MAHSRIALFIRSLFALLLLCGLAANSRADVDFNNDGKADIAFQSTSNATLVYWDLNGPNYLAGGSLPTPSSPAWKLVDSGKMTSNLVPALIYQNSTTNQILYAYLNGATTTGGYVLGPVPAAGYSLVGVADVNGDGNPDLIFQNQTTGVIVFWYMNGTTYLGGAACTTVPAAGYKVVGVGDFNGDGWADLVLQNTTTNQIVFWFLNGTTVVGGTSFPYIPAAGYSVVGLGDVNNTGKPNLILQNATTGQLVYWLLNGTTFAGGNVMTSPTSGVYKAVAIRSFYPRPAPVKLQTLNFGSLYGTVRLRVRSLHDPSATVSVSVGGVVSPSAKIAYVDTAAPDSDIGGAVDFQVPFPLASGAQNVVVTVNGLASPGLPVTVSDTNPFAVFTVQNNTTLATMQFVAELRADVAPITASNFVNLATGNQPWEDPCNNNAVSNAPFYNGLTFHRVIPGFVEQGGDPYSRCLPESDPRIGTGGPGYTINFETTGLTNVDGALAMARGSDVNSASSQFFIDNGPQHDLDATYNPDGTPAGGYVVFGLVVENLANTKAITQTDDSNGNLISGVVPDTMTSVVITGKIDSP